MENKQYIGINVDKTVKTKLLKKARDEGRSLSMTINRILIDALTREESK